MKMTDPALSLQTANIPDIVCGHTTPQCSSRGVRLGQNVVKSEWVGRKTYSEISRHFPPQRKPPTHQFQMLNTGALSLTKRLTPLCVFSIFLLSQNPFELNFVRYKYLGPKHNPVIIRPESRFPFVCFSEGLTCFLFQ